MKNFLNRLFLDLVKSGTLESDSEDERLHKTLFVQNVLIAFFFSAALGLTYVCSNLYFLAVLPLVYTGTTCLALASFLISKKYRFVLTGQIFLLLVLPFWQQVRMGGFMASGGVCLWSIVAPFTTMIFSYRNSSLWFVGYFALLLVFGFLDKSFSQAGAALSPPMSKAFLVVNFAGVLAGLYFTVQYFVRLKDQAKKALQEEHMLLVQEQERSERLLLNILPKSIATRLKNEQRSIADGFEEVSVLFADIVGFTKLSARVAPADLVAMLNEIFSEFDLLAEKHCLEKIKTIGDAYMVVAGLPEPKKNHAEAIADMALEMQKVISERAGSYGEPLSIRIGIHCGPVVAGVIGVKKFIYDLWGDTVNTASRMESHGSPGRIQVTESMYQLLKGSYDLQDCGIVEVKGKGEMHTYWLIGKKA